MSTSFILDLVIIHIGLVRYVAANKIINCILNNGPWDPQSVCLADVEVTKMRQSEAAARRPPQTENPPKTALIRIFIERVPNRAT